MIKDIKDGIEINPQLLQDQAALKDQEHLINSLRAYLISALIVAVVGIICVLWGFGGFNNRFLARFSEHTRAITAWSASLATAISLLFSAFLVGVMTNAKKHFKTEVVGFNEKYPLSKYSKEER